MTIADDIVADVESLKTRVSAGFARFYAPLAILTFFLTFFPYYEANPDSSVAYGNLWQEVARTGHSYDVMAVAMFVTAIALLALAALEKLGPVGLIVAAACTMLIGGLLWASPGFSEKPTHTYAGVADIVACLLGAVMLLSHALCILALNYAGKRNRTGAT